MKEKLPGATIYDDYDDWVRRRRRRRRQNTETGPRQEKSQTSEKVRMEIVVKLKSKDGGWCRIITGTGRCPTILPRVALVALS